MSSCLLALLPLALSGGGADAKNTDQPAEILTPKEGDVVSSVEEYQGRLNGTTGWPVVVVRCQSAKEPWWVQPAVEEVEKGQFTGRAYFGNSDTPAGTRFSVVVLLARDRNTAHAFKAGTTMKALPAGLPRSRGRPVYRDARPARERAKAARTLDFSGYRWAVKQGRGIGPGPNDFSDDKDSAWVDDRGHLHLVIRKHAGRWQCAEVIAPRSLGHGEYRWVVAGALPELAPQVVLGLFTYESHTREIDFELSRWGEARKSNAQFVVQPYTDRDSTFRFDTGKAELLTVSFLWTKDLVHARCWPGEDTTQTPLADWKYSGRRIPPPGRERARANLWIFGKYPGDGERQEVVIRSFRFFPAGKREKSPLR